MMAELTNLSGRIRSEISGIEEIASLAARRWRKSQEDEDYLGSVAFDLQSFYQGIERVFAEGRRKAPAFRPEI